MQTLGMSTLAPGAQSRKEGEKMVFFGVSKRGIGRFSCGN
jgi:hypothetical protein